MDSTAAAGLKCLLGSGGKSQLNTIVRRVLTWTFPALSTCQATVYLKAEQLRTATNKQLKTLCSSWTKAKMSSAQRQLVHQLTATPSTLNSSLDHRTADNRRCIRENLACHHPAGIQVLIITNLNWTKGISNTKGPLPTNSRVTRIKCRVVTGIGPKITALL